MKKNISIFHLSAFPYYTGGIDTWLYNLLSSLDGRYHITVYCPNPNDKSKEVIYDLSHLSTTRVVYIGEFHSYFTMVTWALKVFISQFSKIDKNSKILVLSTIPSFFPVILLKLFGRIKSEIVCSVRGQLARDAVEVNKNFVFQWAIKFIEG
ncbi:MAG TPA: hypothetical protein PLS50_08795, partial [Candidatus Dojkabacteria bacterium]|nr:hypothetical protein [Candidatus Dojkabacteria bacterium]